MTSPRDSIPESRPSLETQDSSPLSEDEFRRRIDLICRGLRWGTNRSFDRHNPPIPRISVVVFPFFFAVVRGGNSRMLRWYRMWRRLKRVHRQRELGKDRASEDFFWHIKVGTPVARRPPCRSRRAELPHRAPRKDAQPVRRRSLVWVFGFRSYRFGGCWQCGSAPCFHDAGRR